MEHAGARLYLIRHARTLPTGLDSHLWPLSPEGEAEAERLAEASFWGDVSALYSSPEHKAVATVRGAAARHNLSLRTDDRLREVGRPARWIDDYDGAVRGYLRDKYPPPDWESMSEARARMMECIGKVSARHPCESVAVCSHGLALTLYLSGLGLAQGDAFHLWRSIGFAWVAVVEDGRLVRPFVRTGER